MISARFVALLILLCCTQTSLSIGRTICFSRNSGEIWVADESGKNAKFVCKGWDPDIDPSGSFVAYTVNTSTANSVFRSIGIAGIHDGTKVLMRSIPGTNSYGPKWNRTGDRLLFSWFDEIKAQWRIGMVKAFRDSEFKLIDGLNYGSETCLGFIKDTVCRDGQDVYFLSPEGKLTDKYPLTRFGNAWFQDIDSGLAYSDDGNFILYSGVVPGEFWPSMGEANSALFILDRRNKVFKRLTPKNVWATDPIWFSTDLILFDGFTGPDIKTNKKTGESAPSAHRLYLIDRNGNNLQPFVENASEPSISKSK